MTLAPMPWRMLQVCVLLGVVGGAIFGFVRGLDYTPTLVVAIGEGAILFGVPAWVVGLLLVAGWSLGERRGRRLMTEYQVGDRVIVIAGPLAGATATVEFIDVTTATLRVLVDVRGRTTPLEVEPHQLRATDL